MSRPLRIEYPGAYYHVMNRGLSHGKVFVEDEDREQFFILIGELTRIWGLKVHAYCLMDTHYHLLLQTPMGELSRAMRHLEFTLSNSTGPMEETGHYFGGDTRPS